jgi:hypothetical protein
VDDHLDEALGEQLQGGGDEELAGEQPAVQNECDRRRDRPERQRAEELGRPHRRFEPGR